MIGKCYWWSVGSYKGEAFIFGFWKVLTDHSVLSKNVFDKTLTLIWVCFLGVCFEVGWTEYFQIQKWILQAVRSEKVDEQNGVICLVSMFPSWVMVLQLSKKVNFLQFYADLNKKSKSIKAIYIYASERSR